MKQVVFEIMIETPKSSVVKYDYDKKLCLFKLKKSLPAGMSFPYDFGFIPGTKGDDGGELDVVMLGEYSTFPGCTVDCRIAGVITARQSSADGSSMIRNDRFFAIPIYSRAFSNIHSITDLPGTEIKDLEEFFINYNKAEGKKFEPIGILGPEEAVALITSRKNEHSL